MAMDVRGFHQLLHAPARVSVRVCLPACVFVSACVRVVLHSRIMCVNPCDHQNAGAERPQPREDPRPGHLFIPVVCSLGHLGGPAPQPVSMAWWPHMAHPRSRCPPRVLSDGFCTHGNSSTALNVTRSTHNTGVANWSSSQGDSGESRWGGRKADEGRLRPAPTQPSAPATLTHPPLTLPVMRDKGDVQPLGTLSQTPLRKGWLQ